MTASLPQFQTDQFAQIAAKGDQDLAITRSGVIAGVLAGASVTAGTRVKLDNSVTTPGVPVFVAAADNEAAFGVVKRTAKATTFVAGDGIEVMHLGGPAVYEVSNATFAPGTLVAMGSGFLVAVDGTHLQMGILIDYVVQSSTGRVILGWQPC